MSRGGVDGTSLDAVMGEVEFEGGWLDRAALRSPLDLLQQLSRAVGAQDDEHVPEQLRLEVKRLARWCSGRRRSPNAPQREVWHQKRRQGPHLPGTASSVATAATPGSEGVASSPARA